MTWTGLWPIAIRCLQSLKLQYLILHMIQAAACCPSSGGRLLGWVVPGECVRHRQQLCSYVPLASQSRCGLMSLLSCRELFWTFLRDRKDTESHFSWGHLGTSPIVWQWLVISTLSVWSALQHCHSHNLYLGSEKSVKRGALFGK